MKAEQLRKAILQMAIQGKLVPQDPKDEPASVLLEKIRAEKQKLIKEGKIKKDKVDSVIFKGEDNRHYEKVGNNALVCIEDELPFEIPESWEWIKIGTISCPIGSKENQILTSEIMKQGAIPVVSQSQNLIDGYTNYLEKQIITHPLIMFGDHTKVVKYIDFNFVIGADGTKFHKAILVFPKYLYLLVLFYASQMPSRGYARHYSILKKEYMPLPPLAEQERIVSEIEKYEPLLNEYDKLEQQKSKLDSEIYDKLKKSILQYAIQGKLVPQDESDEPASELLMRIRAEKKAQLGKKCVDSYIYKGDDNCYYEKVGSEVKNITEEVPFDIPEKWEWMRLKQIINFSKSSSISSEQISYDAWVLDLEDIEKDSGIVIRKKRMSEVKAKSDKHKFDRGNVLYSKLRPYLNKVVVADGDGFCTSEILAFDFSPIMSEYAQVYLMSPFFVDYAMNGAYGVKMPRIGSERGNNALMPLPPLDEQNRIVLKFNEMFDKLKDEV